MDGQTRIVLKGLDKGVHCDIIIEDGIQIWRNSRFHNCIIFWGLVTHISYLPLFWDVNAIKMIVSRRAISAALVHTQIAVTEGRASVRTKQLIIATMAAAVMVVLVVGAFFNVVVFVVICAWLIFEFWRHSSRECLLLAPCKWHSLWNLPFSVWALQSPQEFL